MTDETAKDLYYLNMQTYKKMPKEYRNWIYWDEYHNKATGFSGWCYKKNGKVVMIVKGTDVFEKQDRQNDYALANNRVPEQLKDARKFRQKIVNENPGSELIQTGYSLGGSITMALGAVTGDRTYTYSAFGIKDGAGKDAKYFGLCQSFY